MILTGRTPCFRGDLANPPPCRLLKLLDWAIPNRFRSYIGSASHSTFPYPPSFQKVQRSTDIGATRRTWSSHSIHDTNTHLESGQYIEQLRLGGLRSWPLRQTKQLSFQLKAADLLPPKIRGEKNSNLAREWWHKMSSTLPTHPL